MDRRPEKVLVYIDEMYAKVVEPMSKSLMAILYEKNFFSEMQLFIEFSVQDQCFGKFK